MVSSRLRRSPGGRNLHEISRLNERGQFQLKPQSVSLNSELGHIKFNMTVLDEAFVLINLWILQYTKTATICHCTKLNNCFDHSTFSNKDIPLSTCFSKTFRPHPANLYVKNATGTERVKGNVNYVSKGPGECELYKGGGDKGGGGGGEMCFWHPRLPHTP